MSALRRPFLAGAITGSLLTATAARLAQYPQLRVARMPGSSIAAPDAAGWVTDFLNAAYYRRPAGTRDVADLRLAHTILTTRWWSQGYRRLRGTDVVAFHRAFGRARFLDSTVTARGTLDRTQLMAGAVRLLGEEFAVALADERRRGWGIAFPTDADRAAYRPQERLRHGALGSITPPIAAPERQTWHTYRPVEIQDTDRALAGLMQPETWPDYGSQLGRFTPVRAGGLAGQTFEIEIVGLPETAALVVVRAYVTCTLVLTATDDAVALDAHVENVNAGLAGVGPGELLAVPAGAQPLAAIDLTTHEGHFLGSARSRLLVFRAQGRTWMRDVGQWDPLPWPLDPLYQRGGLAAQEAFWGPENPDQSMLAQFSAVTAAR